eukprot:797220-Amphidinium_carterae.1
MALNAAPVTIFQRESQSSVGHRTCSFAALKKALQADCNTRQDPPGKGDMRHPSCHMHYQWQSTCKDIGCC